MAKSLLFCAMETSRAGVSQGCRGQVLREVLFLYENREIPSLYALVTKLAITSGSD